MKDEDINIAIAKEMGYKFAGEASFDAETVGWKAADEFAMKPDGGMVFKHAIPDYCNNLNAMHEAVQSLSNKEYIVFCDTLKRMTEVEWHAQIHSENANVFWRYINEATARQRARAFLRTIGKWED